MPPGLGPAEGLDRAQWARRGNRADPEGFLLLVAELRPLFVVAGLVAVVAEPAAAVIVPAKVTPRAQETQRTRQQHTFARWPGQDSYPASLESPLSVLSFRIWNQGGELSGRCAASKEQL